MEEAYDVAVEALGVAQALYTNSTNEMRVAALTELLEQLVAMLAP